MPQVSTPLEPIEQAAPAPPGIDCWHTPWNAPVPYSMQAAAKR